MSSSADDTTGSRTIELEVEVPGTPEEVWEAVASGPGITAWFVPATVDGRAGGTVELDFGPGYGTETAQITAWEPPHRFVAESSGRPGFAAEWLVEARDGGTCVVRLIQHGFGSGAEWDAEYDATTEGWLGLPTGPSNGERVAATAAGAPPLAGVVERAEPNMLTLLLEKPAPGVAFVVAEPTGDGNAAASVYTYLFGEGAAEVAASQEPAVRDWMGRHFPLPEAPAGS
jgi:uncharacterized protein YndB with AHSA1/START domain